MKMMFFLRNRFEDKIFLVLLYTESWNGEIILF